MMGGDLGSPDYQVALGFGEMFETSHRRMCLLTKSLKD